MRGVKHLSYLLASQLTLEDLKKQIWFSGNAEFNPFQYFKPALVIIKPYETLNLYHKKY